MKIKKYQKDCFIGFAMSNCISYFKVLEDDFPDWFFKLKRSGGLRKGGKLRCNYAIRYDGGNPIIVLDYQINRKALSVYGGDIRLTHLTDVC